MQWPEPHCQLQGGGSIHRPRSPLKACSLVRGHGCVTRQIGVSLSLTWGHGAETNKATSPESSLCSSEPPSSTPGASLAGSGDLQVVAQGGQEVIGLFARFKQTRTQEVMQPSLHFFTPSPHPAQSLTVAVTSHPLLPLPSCPVSPVCLRLSAPFPQARACVWKVRSVLQVLTSISTGRWLLHFQFFERAASVRQNILPLAKVWLISPDSSVAMLMKSLWICYSQTPL